MQPFRGIGLIAIRRTRGAFAGDFSPHPYAWNSTWNSSSPLVAEKVKRPFATRRNKRAKDADNDNEHSGTTSYQTRLLKVEERWINTDIDTRNMKNGTDESSSSSA